MEKLPEIKINQLKARKPKKNTEISLTTFATMRNSKCTDTLTGLNHIMQMSLDLIIIKRFNLIMIRQPYKDDIGKI